MEQLSYIGIDIWNMQSVNQFYTFWLIWQFVAVISCYHNHCNSNINYYSIMHILLSPLLIAIWNGDVSKTIFYRDTKMSWIFINRIHISNNYHSEIFFVDISNDKWKYYISATKYGN